MYCTACGADIPHGSRFCKKCGVAQPLRESLDSAPASREAAGNLDSLSDSDGQGSGNRMVWIGIVVVPLVVLCALLAMIGAMRPSEKKAPEFTSPRQISFSSTGPDSVRIGVPTEFRYEVSNTGTADLKAFRIAFPESIDKAFEVSSSRPEAAVLVEGGKRLLAFGNLAAGQTASFTVVLVPKADGEQEVKATFLDGSTPVTNDRGDGMIYKKVKVSP